MILSIFQLHMHLQRQSTVSVDEAMARARSAMARRAEERGGIDGLPPDPSYPYGERPWWARKDPPDDAE